MSNPCIDSPLLRRPWSSYASAPPPCKDALDWRARSRTGGEGRVGVGRNALLWSSRNRWLREQVPRLPFVRRAVLRFMPGETLDSALDVAREFGRRGLPTTFTHLGENVGSQEDAGAVVRHYMDALDRVAEAGVDSEISVKPTHLGLEFDPGLAADNLLRMARAASERTNCLWVDMDSSAYEEGTLQLYRRARDAPSNGALVALADARR